MLEGYINNNLFDDCNDFNINIKPCKSCRYIQPTGLSGSGGVLNYADFYALMLLYNSATVAPNTDVSFPQDGPNSGSGITRLSDSSFNILFYLVFL